MSYAIGVGVYIFGYALANGYVDDRMWGHLEAGFDAADFWNLQSERSTGRSDGNGIYREGCKNGTYHAAQRDSDDPDLARSSGPSQGSADWNGWRPSRYSMASDCFRTFSAH